MSVAITRPGGAHPLGGRERRLAGTRRQVKHLVAGLELRQLEHGFGHGAQPGLERGRPAVPRSRGALPLLSRRLFECDWVEVGAHDAHRERTLRRSPGRHPSGDASARLYRESKRLRSMCLLIPSCERSAAQDGGPRWSRTTYLGGPGP